MVLRVDQGIGQEPSALEVPPLAAGQIRKEDNDIDT